MVRLTRAGLLVRLGIALAGLVAVAVLLTSFASWPRGLADTPSWLARGPADTRVVTAAVAGAWLCLARLGYALVAAAVRAVLAPRRPGAARRHPPARRLAERILGLSTVAVVTYGALAPPVALADGPTGPFDRPVSGTRTAAARASPRRAGAAITVAPGDTLWDIAARATGAGASVTAIAASWPRWYAANRAVIGPDPDVILPGQRLRPPATDPGGVP